MARITLPESRIRVRRRRRIMRTVLAWGVLLFLIALILIGLSWLPQLRLRDVSVVGTQTIASTTIAQIMEQELARTYWYVLPRSNVLLYPKESIADMLLMQFSPLKKVTVDFENFHTLRVVVEERTPAALWCGEEPHRETPCTFLDQAGVAYAQAPEYSQGVYVRYFGPLATTTPPQYARGAFESLHALVAALGEKTGGDRVDTVAITSDRDVKVALLSGCEIIFALGQDSATVVNHFILALSSSVFADHSLSEFEYIDLRYGNKLYYKLKNQ